MSRALKVGAIVFLLAILAGIVRSQNGAYQSPATGAIYTATSPITVTGTVIACPTCGTGTGNVTAAGTLTNNAVVIGGGGQATSTISADTTTTHALFATAGGPAFRAIAVGDVPFSAPGPIGGSSPSSVNWSSLLNQTHMVCTGANPTIGTGVGATIASGNGSCSFTINVGTGGLSSIVIAFSGTSVQSGWICSATDRTTLNITTAWITKQTNSALSTTTATIGNFDSTGTSHAWPNSDLLSLQCAAD